MKIELYYGKPAKYDFYEIIDQFNPNSINSIKTSTIPLLEYWKNSQVRIKLLKDRLELNSKLYKICYEYPTKSYKSNKSSMTDLMILGQNEKISIEAKYTEVNEKIELINAWNNKTENRENVLDHWIEIIKPYLSNNLSNQVFKNKIATIPYQFLHRTASACFENNGKAYVIYQIFYDSHTKIKMDKFISILKKSVEILNPNEKLKFYLYSIEIDLVKEINKESVLKFIKNNQLYSFKNELFYEIKI